MISGRDIRIAGKFAQLDETNELAILERLAHLPVQEFYSKPLRSCTTTDTIVDAAKLMRLQNVSSLAIEKHGVVVGIITRSDLLDQLIRLYEPVVDAK